MWGKNLFVLLFVSVAMFGFLGNAWAQATQTPSMKPGHMMMERSRGGSGGGGPLMTAALLDLKELENALPGLTFGGDFTVSDKKIFLMAGGGGLGGPGHMRFGGEGWGGEWNVPYDDKTHDFNRAILSIDGGGFLIEHILHSSEKIGLSIGASIGGSDVKLRLFKQISSQPWADVVRSAKSLELKRSYFMVEPYISIRLTPVGFISFRISVGYLYQMSFEDWELPDETKATSGPLKTLSAPVFSVMIYFGR
ncbi:hypothetical protein HYR54_12245 [Candidatus Acetothermia bacterium]|nr:hypothetical protein [Candidatus Acetothermia bacterium]MBI3460988.1 hypothetical protein [Candidatus Acetothermia bacterium]MBI3660940.1 hypothetical protein [Candidatus Acetothermia bacterium]